MIKDSSASRIQLSDRDFETEDILVYLLDIIRCKPIETEDVYEIPRLTNVVRLARKYICADALMRISLQCRVDMYEKKCRPLLPLMMGFALNDMDLCEKALATPGGRWESEEWPGEFGDPFDGIVMDPTALPLEISRVVKPETMWTWIRAYRLSESESRDLEVNNVACEGYAENFKSLTELWRGECPVFAARVRKLT